MIDRTLEAHDMTTRKLLTLALGVIAAATLLTGCDVPKGACVYNFGPGGDACDENQTQYECENYHGNMVGWFPGETCKDQGH